MKRFGFEKAQRLVQRADFDRAFNQGRVASNESLVIHAVLNVCERTRLGISVSKRVGNSPTRNRWKRLIRESFRLQQHELPVGLDLVVRPRKGADADFHLIYDSLAKLVPKLARQLRR